MTLLFIVLMHTRLGRKKQKAITDKAALSSSAAHLFERPIYKP